MYPIVFHSLYDRGSLTSLKHALLYFGKLRIPKTSWLFTFGEDSGDVRYICMPPEGVYEQIAWLVKQDIVQFVPDPSRREDELRRTGGTGVSAEHLYNVILDELDKAGHRTYTPRDLAPVYRYLQLDPRAPAAREALGQVAIMQAAIMLQSVAERYGLPCVDNRPFHDFVHAGTSALFAPLIAASVLTPSEVHALKAQALSQRALALALPAFEFTTFEDVLSMRDVLRDPIARFQEEASNAAAGIDARPWDPDFSAQVEAVVRARILPGIAEVRKAAKFAPLRVARAMLMAGAALSVKPLFPDLLADWVVGGSALALVDAIRQERDRSARVRVDSAFSFLIQVQDRVSDR